MNKKIVFVLLALGGQLTALATPLCRVDTEELTDSSKVIDLDEVVVVSQPKEQVRLRLQPVSSNVFGAEQLQQLNVKDLSQLSQYVPSFVMPSYGSRLTSSMYVRGIGSRINNPAVGVYYDNIPLMSKSAFNNHFYMLDRVDILRGPQGSLYGQNTEGGLVRIYSKNPMNYQGTDVRLGIGTGLYSNVEVAHYHRPSDKLAFSVAGFYSGLKGFVNNQNFDEKNDLTNEAGGKLRLIWQPNKQLKFDWTADYQYVNQNGFGYGEFHPLDYLPEVYSSSFVPADLDVKDPATTIMNGYKRNMFTTGLNIGYETEKLLFTSTTSYQYLNDLMLMDQDYMTPDYLQLKQAQKMNAITQEFVLRSHDSSKWQHATGLFASYQWLNTNAPVLFGDGITGPIGDAIANAMKNSMLQGMIGRFMGQGMSAEAAAAAAQAAVDKMGVTMTAEMAVPGEYKTPTWNFAAFHESNILLGDNWKLTLGLRFNIDKVKIDYDALAYMNMTGGTANAIATYHLTSHVQDSRSKSYTQLLPKIGLTYSFDENIGNIYALVSKGYRAGGYNFQMFSDVLKTELNANQQKAMRGDYDVEHTAADYDAINETIAYKPEESWNYEIGTHLNLFGGSTHFDLALYYMQIRNQQLSIMEPNSNYGRIMVNAGKSHSCGLEATLRGKAIDNALDWAVTYAFTNAKFDEYQHTVGGSTSPNTDTFAGDYDGNYVPFVPQHTLSAMVDWHIGKFTIGANMNGQGKIWWDEANTYAQKFYAVAGAHADYDFGPVLVSLWGRNLTNTHYNTFAVASSAVNGTHYFAQKANPIQIGLDVNIHL
ncbi:Outer membrane receptor proteins, mostly Fe transport [Prevotella sp. khp7]|uniref:TonB-dependent receptor n=1 Tax=Prevotella sp. khp7 TaxID=1761885 RepID=UPI0008C17E35|nr:TonB-dependent receptor [Prevotella sp. khp7]SEW23072.1 Outer membrane receptor proteins, mostly Fe transport [Prevotella sp. khp7]